LYAKRPNNQNNGKVDQIEKNQAVIRLLEEWLADDSGYDEQVWPIVKKDIEENRLSYRKRFNG